MPYPINPPAMHHLSWSQIISPVLHGRCIVKSLGFWFWAPDRSETKPNDWWVGPYNSRKAASSAHSRFVAKMGDGPEIRHGWTI